MSNDRCVHGETGRISTSAEVLWGAVDQKKPLHLLGRVVGHFSHSLHFGQVLFRMIRVDHFVLDRDIVSTKNIDGFSPWMVKVGQVINYAVNAHFGRLELVHAANAFRGGGLLGLGLVGTALTKYFSFRGHGVVFVEELREKLAETVLTARICIPL